MDRRKGGVVTASIGESTTENGDSKSRIAKFYAVLLAKIVHLLQAAK